MLFNVDFIYPVGSVYISFNSTNPSILFGGQWTQLKARFLCGVGELDTINTSEFYGKMTLGQYTIWAGETSGTNFHTLTTDEMPPHTHGLTGRISEGDGAPYPIRITGGEMNWDSWTQTKATGSGYGHNNMPPYFAVYMWKRIS